MSNVTQLWSVQVKLSLVLFLLAQFVSDNSGCVVTRVCETALFAVGGFLTNLVLNPGRTVIKEQNLHLRNMMQKRKERVSNMKSMIMLH